MILDLAEARQFLRIAESDKSQDPLIEALIKPIESDLLDYINNRFVVPGVCVESAQVTFGQADPPTITLGGSGSGFATSNFLAPGDVVVWGSIKNDGFFRVQTVAASVLTLAQGEVLYAEATTRTIYIAQAMIPPALKLIAADMLRYQWKDTQGISTESIGDYSVSYDFRRGDGYPKEILGRLTKYRKVRR